MLQEGHGGVRKTEEVYGKRGRRVITTNLRIMWMKTRKNKEGDEGKWKVDNSDGDYVEHGFLNWGTRNP